jgi:hypothetical protein
VWPGSPWSGGSKVAIVQVCVKKHTFIHSTKAGTPVCLGRSARGVFGQPGGRVEGQAWQGSGAAVLLITTDSRDRYICLADDNEAALLQAPHGGTDNDVERGAGVCPPASAHCRGLQWT